MERGEKSRKTTKLRPECLSGRSCCLGKGGNQGRAGSGGSLVGLGRLEVHMEMSCWQLGVNLESRLGMNK